MDYKLLIMTILLFTITITNVRSDLDIGFGINSPFVNISRPSIQQNYSLVSVNSSDFWGNYYYGDYNLGNSIYWYNHTLHTYNLYNTLWSDTYNATYDAKVSYVFGDCPADKVVQNTTEGGVECIDRDAPSTTYYPFNSSVTGGSYTDVNNITYAWYYDDVWLNFSEGTGASALDVYFNFTNVTEFSQFVAREYYTGNHNVQVEFYDFTTGVWESYFSFTSQSGMTILTIPVYDTEEHLDNNNVSMRFHHIGTGNPSQRLYVDFVWLISGNNVGASTNLQGYAEYLYSYNNFSGNGNFSTTGYFFGNGTYLKGVTNISYFHQQNLSLINLFLTKSQNNTLQNLFVTRLQNQSLQNLYSNINLTGIVYGMNKTFNASTGSVTYDGNFNVTGNQSVGLLQIYDNGTCTFISRGSNLILCP